MKTKHLQTENPQIPDGEAGSGFTSLDSEATSIQLRERSSYRAFLSSGRKFQMLYGEELYRAIDEKTGKHRILRYVNCREDSWFIRHSYTKEIKVASSRCNLRWCPLCQKTKEFIMVNSITEWLKGAKKPKFITLTLSSSDDSLSNQVDKLYKYFRAIRLTKLWKAKIKGGVWFFQITQNEKSKQWHPHLHIIADGLYFDQKDLSNLWAKISNGSTIVDIRAVKDQRKAAKYVARYATAPCNISDLSMDDGIEVFEALESRRICGTFGTGRKIKLSPEKPKDKESWEFLGYYSEIVSKAEKQESYKELVKAWMSGKPCFLDFNQPLISGDRKKVLQKEEASGLSRTLFELYNGI